MDAQELFLYYVSIVTKILTDMKFKYNISQLQMSNIFGISQSTMCRWLSGHYNFKLSDINIIEQTLGITNIFKIKEIGDKID
jgi:transcriptional regulator with XRE-family HTH domain